VNKNIKQTRSKLSIEGSIISDIYLTHTSTGAAVARFRMLEILKNLRLGRTFEITYTFIAFDELAEYIVANFEKGDNIDIASAIPIYNQYFSKEEQKHKGSVAYKIMELGMYQDQYRAPTKEGDNNEEFAPDEDDLPY
jgi:hypothetical protein